MKIVGITYYDGNASVVLKSDSSLLVNRKPLFVPDWLHELQALPCWVLRVSRLGKCIAPRFASRYYDAVAAGVDFFSADKLREALAEGRPWTEAVAFENSLAVGEMEEVGSKKSEVGSKKLEVRWELRRGDEMIEQMTWAPEGMQDALDQAVARVSDLLTIRQGDLIYVAMNTRPWQLQQEDILRCTNDEQERLYCKIK